MLNIGIFLGGGIGDLIIYSPVLQKLYEILQTPFDLITSHHQSGNDRRLFATAPFVKNFCDGNAISQEAFLSYDFIIQLNHFILYQSSQPQLVAKYIPQILPYVEIASIRAAGFEAHIKFQPNFDRVIADYAVLKGLSRKNFILYSSGLDAEPIKQVCYIDPARENAFEQWNLKSKNYITIHDGWDNNQYLQPGTKATKCWPDQYWQLLIDQFKTAYPHLTIVQLGNQNSTRFDNVDLSLVGKIAIDEAGWLLKHSRLHIDTETGLVHLAHAMGTKSVCLTGPTNAAYYNYPDNLNIVSEICKDCWWVKPNWMAKCIRDLPEPECMVSITPQQVMAIVKGELG